MTPEEQFKIFVLSNQMLELDLDGVERQHALDLSRGISQPVLDRDYYPQIESAIRAEAAAMAPHYEVFYSLETTIRRLIDETLTAEHGPAWWDLQCVPQGIKLEAERRLKRERDLGITVRSEAPLDYTNFGELGELIKTNWDVFGGLFTSVKAVERVMSMLNSLRGPIAHCSPLAEDEVVRLRLAVRDWFRLME
jgi:hypothetical protein